jgi:nitrogen fixation/metabolism regulation signal transduction histidine kinase
LTLLALAGGLPAVVIAAAWILDQPARTAIPAGALVFGAWIGVAFAVRRRVVGPLGTLGSLLSAVREGDFTTTAVGAGEADTLGRTYAEINALVETLREQRLGAREATVLLETVMDEIDVAVIAFDLERHAVFVNAAAERLFARPSVELVGETAKTLGLAECFEGPVPRTLELTEGTGVGRWELRRSRFRQHGRPMTLLVLSDPGRIRRQRERDAWRRIIRVLGHEINNSLAPIVTIVDALKRRVVRGQPLGPDLEQSLDVIGKRADGLRRFMEAYAALAKLPAPKPGPVHVRDWVHRVIELESRVRVRLDPDESEAITIRADAVQLEQLLINVIRNAVDAAREVDPDEARVSVGWRLLRDRFELWVRDNGPGIANPDNLFVPFFSTKPAGSGIGLVLSQQIAEGHGGALSLANHPDGGAELRLELPTQDAVESGASTTGMSVVRT